MSELHGEKIDIVDFSDDPAEMVAHALSPAQVSSVEIVSLEQRSARVVVPDFQLSLAIGKEGQNARLAARLTGWRIDIRSDEAPADAAGDAAVGAPVRIPGALPIELVQWFAHTAPTPAPTPPRPRDRSGPASVAGSGPRRASCYGSWPAREPTVLLSFPIPQARPPVAGRTCTPRPRATTSRCAGGPSPEPSGSSTGCPAHR